MTAVLVTGAAGYIGSHFTRVAHDAGLRVIAIDDLSTTPSWPRSAVIDRVTGDVGDRSLVAHLLDDREVDAIVHFAGRICVEESVRRPALYFEQNFERTVALLAVATAAKKRPTFVLSSSAGVYGQPDHSPITEDTPVGPFSPYGASKLLAEGALAKYGGPWAALRYFNAAGAHPDGSLRERHDPETHLIPLAIDASLGTRQPLVVYGDDHPTRDGSCVRDYVHVMDLAEAHLAALTCKGGIFNLGSGNGATVREVLAEVGRVVGRPVPHTIGPRRAGDPSELVADIGRAAEVLGWRPRRGLGQIVEDALRSRQV